MVCVACVNPHPTAMRHVDANLGRPLDHLRRERTHCTHERIVSGLGPHGDLLCAGGGHDQTAFGQRVIQLVHHLRLQTQLDRVLHQCFGTGATARSHHDLFHSQALFKRFQVRTPLYPRTYQQQLATWVRRELLSRQQRHSCGAPGGHGRAIEHAEQPPITHTKHQHIALYGGQSTRRVVRDKRDQLGDRPLMV